jgi:hypothetical protein
MQTFYNLDKRRDRMLKGDSVTEYGWALFGMVHERTIDADTKGTKFTRVKGFCGNVGLGTKPIERAQEQFDYLDFVALYNEKYEGPESYQGTSGGGLWQLEYRDIDGKIDVTEALLSGVAYFESARPADTRTIYCHGRRSIYEHVLRCNEVMAVPFETIQGEVQRLRNFILGDLPCVAWWAASAASEWRGLGGRSGAGPESPRAKRPFSFLVRR